MTILKEKVKELTIPIIFTRESSDSHNRKTFVYLAKTAHIRVWNEEPFKEMTLSLSLGHGQTYEDEDGTIHYQKWLRIFWRHNKNCIEELEDFRIREFEGLTITVDEDEKVLPEKEAVELIKSGQVKFLNEDLSKRTLYV